MNDNGYIKLEWTPELERPVLVAAFQGWNDAAEAATLATGTITEQWDARRFAAFDPEEFFDFQATRPQVRLVDGYTRQVEWPENYFLAASGDRELVLLSGPEPNLRWRVFCEAVTRLARKLDVELVVTLGALLADVPHSRPVSVAANSQDPELIRKLGLSSSRYEGPTGIVGVLHRHCADAGLPSVSFWASVPHYLPSMPSSPAALALLGALSKLLDIRVDTAALQKSAREYERQVSAVVAQDENLVSYVQMLEERYDSQVEQGGIELPTGDQLAAELENFLREEREE
ncbi:PAC2 family protein [Rubrobacter taiwanensis]|jgi:predicted ATP-grasp superfamily ATP-dependent carboligase|uniref:PAC2 family protein n=1 Tax=Rubrobacter taiwanensis TaxID=185139 RepID=A0A4R1BM10_9ACTN|nr:PAC2 family protein [Rubrobacter taiwanensis]TCJ18463.1 PAC2 family protein [Rubrobacter taiwanensis]